MRLVAVTVPLLAALLLVGCGGADHRTERTKQPKKPPGPNPSGRPDVVVVMIDTLRPDHLDLYGYERETAPFLRELAASSTVFRRAWSTSSWTAPATASLFTSAYPTRHGVTKGFFATRDVQEQVAGGEAARMTVNRITEDLPTMPELFRDAGYRTFGLTANVNVGEEIGFRRGFDRFERLHDLTYGSSGEAEDLERRLADWQGDIAEADPAFVYLHFNDVHHPYRRHAPYYEEQETPNEDAKAAYDSEIRTVDESLRRIFDRFGWDRDDGPIVVVVSDHGEEFREHGGRLHQLSLYRELTQVVSMIRVPGGEAGSAKDMEARVVEANISLIDLLPTLVELAGLAPLDNAEGISLAPLIWDEAAGDDLALQLTQKLATRPLFAHRQGARHAQDETLQAVFKGDLHLIAGPGGVQLFDLAADPVQQHDLASSQPADVERLLEHLRGFEAVGTGTDGAYADDPEIEIDAEALEQLRSLGYVE